MEEKILLSVDDKIKIRNNWLKIFVIVALVLLFIIKLSLSPLTFDFTKFDFSDLLSLLMAIFAIALSVAFYFKSTDTSNLFYDNTYKFTKEISEILGRIEAGFGERLKHLDEGYAGLREKFSAAPTQPTETIKETQDKLESEKKKLEQEINARNKIIDDLMRKANLGEKDKEHIVEKLNERENEISMLNRELRNLTRKLDREEVKLDDIYFMVPDKLKSYLREYFHKFIDNDFLLEAPDEIIRMELRFSPHELPPGPRRDLKEYDLVDSDFLLTQKGISLLKSIAKRN
jgi:hypothetical protein